jgi:hypothetical protein
VEPSNSIYDQVNLANAIDAVNDLSCLSLDVLPELSKFCGVIGDAIDSLKPKSSSSSSSAIQLSISFLTRQLRLSITMIDGSQDRLVLKFDALQAILPRGYNPNFKNKGEDHLQYLVLELTLGDVPIQSFKKDHRKKTFTNVLAGAIGSAKYVLDAKNWFLVVKPSLKHARELWNLFSTKNEDLVQNLDEPNVPFMDFVSISSPMTMRMSEAEASDDVSELLNNLSNDKLPVLRVNRVVVGASEETVVPIIDKYSDSHTAMMKIVTFIDEWISLRDQDSMLQSKFQIQCITCEKKLYFSRQGLRVCPPANDPSTGEPTGEPSGSTLPMVRKRHFLCKSKWSPCDHQAGADTGGTTMTMNQEGGNDEDA